MKDVQLKTSGRKEGMKVKYILENEKEDKNVV